MYWVTLSFLLSFGFGQLFKWSQRCGYRPPVVLAANYLTVAGALVAHYSLTSGLSLSCEIIGVGVAGGIAFITSMLVMTHALERASVASVFTAFRLSILVPILPSLWLWNENIEAIQLVGILLAAIALSLMTQGEVPASNLSKRGHIALLVLVFITQGLSHCSMRWIHYAGLDDQRQLVLLTIAGTAGTIGASFTCLRCLRPRRRELHMGFSIGMFNLLALTILLTALAHVPGSLFFPLQGCAVVILDNSFAHFFWKERLTRPVIAGTALAAFSMLLVL